MLCNCKVKLFAKLNSKTYDRFKQRNKPNGKTEQYDST